MGRDGQLPEGEESPRGCRLPRARPEPGRPCRARVVTRLAHPDCALDPLCGHCTCRLRGFRCPECRHDLAADRGDPRPDPGDLQAGRPAPRRCRDRVAAPRGRARALLVERAARMKSHTVYKTFEVPGAAQLHPHHRRRAGGRGRGWDRRGDGPRLRHAHHRRCLGERRRARPPRRHAGMARQGRAPELAGAGERGGAGALTRSWRLPPPSPAARTAATPTSRTCSSTTRRSCRSPTASSTSGPGSRSSFSRSTAFARSG